MTDLYVEHPFTRPAEWPSAALEAGWPGHIAATLRALGVEIGLSVTGEPEQVGDPIPVQVPTDDGLVDCLTYVYRAPAEGSRQVKEATVQAEETAPGVWKATVPQGVTILSVRHGLGTRQVDVNLVDGNGFPTGYVAPVPIDVDEVEVVLSPDSKARHAFVTLVLEDDEGGGHRPDVQSPRQANA